MRVGGFIIPVVSTESGNKVITVNIPANSRIMCSNCSLENESTLISNGNVAKVTNGYVIKNDIEKLKILRSVTNTPALSILKGQEVLYCESQLTSSGDIFDLPKGFRVNGTICEVNGENTIPSKDHYLIEF